MEERTTFFPWEQEGVIHLQQALNSQIPVQPVPYPAMWGEETLDLSSTSTISSSYPHYSPPSRLTILNPRNIVLSHPMTGTGPHHGAEDSPVTSTREGQEDRRARLKTRDSEQERLCKVCGEKAGKHSYYGGQVNILLVLPSYSSLSPGLSFLPGILQALSAVWLQCHLLLCEGWAVPGDTQDKEELPGLQVQAV